MSIQTEETINQQYREQLAAQQAQLQAQRDQAEAEYNLQKSGAKDTYNSMRKTAHADSAMADRARRESMANMGLSSAGGMSQTLAQRGSNALMGAVGSANKQEQDYKNNIDLALGNLNTQFDANMASATSQNQAALNAELSQYSQWQANYEMQQEQMAQTQQSAIFDQAYALYVKKKISRRQFENMTGLDLG